MNFDDRAQYAVMSPTRALWHAIKRRNPQALSMALTRGADIRSVDSFGLPPLTALVCREIEKGTGLWRKNTDEMFNALLGAGADPNQPCKQGLTCLSWLLSWTPNNLSVSLSEQKKPLGLSFKGGGSSMSLLEWPLSFERCQVRKDKVPNSPNQVYPSIEAHPGALLILGPPLKTLITLEKKPHNQTLSTKKMQNAHQRSKGLNWNIPMVCHDFTETTKGRVLNLIPTEHASTIRLFGLCHLQCWDDLLSLDPFLEGSPDVNICHPKTNQSLLMLAVKKGHFMVVEKLIKLGADPTKKDHQGKSALDLVDRNKDIILPMVETAILQYSIPNSQIKIQSAKSRL